MACYTYPSTSACSWTRELGRLAAHLKLGISVAGRLHVAELVRAFLAGIVVAASDHDLRLTGKDGVASDFHRLESGGAM